MKKNLIFCPPEILNYRAKSVNSPSLLKLNLLWAAITITRPGRQKPSSATARGTQTKCVIVRRHAVAT